MDDTATRVNVPTPAGGADPSGRNENTQRRAAVIEGEIEQGREELAETIDAIQDKLRPSTILANAKKRAKAVTTERVKAMAGTAGGAAHNVMDRTREGAGDVFDILRENPLPTTLVGVGLAWLLMRSRTSSAQQLGAWSDDWDKTESSAGRRSGREQSGQQSSGSSFGPSVTDRAREYKDETTAAVRRTSRRAHNQFERAMRQNPLLVGAGALALGAAFGLAVPETEVENEWMGEVRDSMVDRAQQMAGDAAQRVTAVATEVADAAAGVADSVSSKQRG